MEYRTHQKRSASGLEIYLAEVGKTHPLSRDEETKLAQRIKRGDQKAREKLIKANLRFVVEVALKYRGRGLPLGDLISAGNMGLIVAVEKFDGSKGIKLISYAVWWIRQAILQALHKEARVVRLPVNRIDDISKFRKTLDEVFGENPEAGEPSDEQLAVILECSTAEIWDRRLIGQTSFSLDFKLDQDDADTFMDILEDDKAPWPDDVVEYHNLQEIIQNSIGVLDDREQKVLIWYFGLDGEKDMTLEEIGLYFGLSRERVRQIKVKALKRLRHKANSAALEAAL